MGPDGLPSPGAKGTATGNATAQINSAGTPTSLAISPEEPNVTAGLAFPVPIYVVGQDQNGFVGLVPGDEVTIDLEVVTKAGFSPALGYNLLGSGANATLAIPADTFSVAVNGVATFPVLSVSSGAVGGTTAPTGSNPLTKGQFFFAATAGAGTLISNTAPLPPTFSVSGYTPAQVRSAYGYTGLTSSGKTLDGTGQTIAIVDAFNDPSIYNDLDVFDSQYGLTQYGPAWKFLTVFNQKGAPISDSIADSGQGNVPPLSPDVKTGDVEVMLDVEWAHAIAPGANIMLVETNSQDPNDLLTGALWAASQAKSKGVSVVSMSFGKTEAPVNITTSSLAITKSFETKYDSLFAQAPNGVTFVAGTGDAGAGNYPAFSPDVLAVGATALEILPDGTYGGEDGWFGSGGGKSNFEVEPPYQQPFQTTGSRTIPDVSFLGSSQTPVSTYDSETVAGPNSFGYTYGTRLAAPMMAGLIALVNQGRANATPKLAPLNSNGPGSAVAAFYDLPQADYNIPNNSLVATSTTGINPNTQYNEVTGLGTPNVPVLVPALIAYVPLTLSPASLPVGAVDVDYTPTTITASGGTGAITSFSFTVTSGPLPDSLA